MKDADSVAKTHFATGARPAPAGAGAQGDDAQPPGDPPDAYVGRLIGERYRILARLGEGGMGLVFRGEHVLMKKPVAIKLLHRELGSLDDAVKRFEREAQSASRLSHPSIVGVTDFGRAESGELFLVMEFVPGVHLGDYLERTGRLSPLKALSVCRMILRGLAHAHQAGVVHRDLKPANVMLVERDGEPRRIEGVKILDFGIAKMTESAGTAEVALTRGGMIFGTPSYMSPEQATGEQVDHRTDIYACGVMLYEMLAGRKPFVADDLVKIMAMQVTAPPPSFDKVVPKSDIPAVLERVVMRALEKERQRRYASAIDFLAALDQAESHIQAGEPSRVSLQRRVRRSREGAPGSSWQGVVARASRRLAVAWAEPKQRRLLLGAGAVALALVFVPTLLGREPVAPKPVKAALRGPLKQAEHAIADGQIPEAKAILMQQLSSHPDSARVHFLLGTIAFSESDPDAGLERYGEALALDPGLRGDAALLYNVKALLADRRRDAAALAFLAEKVGAPAGETLAEIASRDLRSHFRQTARAACETHDCLDDVDLVGSFELDLRQAKTCDAKREAIGGLTATRDARVIDILKKARRNRSGTLGRWLGLEGGNDCVRKEIEDALKELGAS